jgi:hypothetical protein
MLGAQCIKWPSNDILMPIILCDISPNIMNIFVRNAEFEVYIKLVSHTTYFISDPGYIKLQV